MKKNKYFIILLFIFCCFFVTNAKNPFLKYQLNDKFISFVDAQHQKKYQIEERIPFETENGLKMEMIFASLLNGDGTKCDGSYVFFNPINLELFYKEFIQAVPDTIYQPLELQKLYVHDLGNNEDSFGGALLFFDSYISKDNAKSYGQNVDFGYYGYEKYWKEIKLPGSIANTIVKWLVGDYKFKFPNDKKNFFNNYWEHVKTKELFFEYVNEDHNIYDEGKY